MYRRGAPIRDACAHTCDLPYLRVEDIEDAVLHHYATLSLAPGTKEIIADLLQEELTTQESSHHELVTTLTKELARLDEQSQRLLHALMNGLAAEGEIQHLLNDIQLKRHNVQERLDATHQTLAYGIDAAQKWLALASHSQDLYQAATDDARSVLNRAFFARLLLDLDDGTAQITTAHELNAPLDTLYADLTAEHEATAPFHSSLTNFVQNMQEERPNRDAPRSGASRSESSLLALSSNKTYLVDFVTKCWNNRYPLTSIGRHIRLEATDASLQLQSVRDTAEGTRAPTVRHKVSQRLTTAQQLQVVAYYDAGHSSRETAERFGMGKATVMRLVRELGHVSRPVGPIPSCRQRSSAPVPGTCL